MEASEEGKQEGLSVDCCMIEHCCLLINMTILKIFPKNVMLKVYNRRGP